MPHPDDELLSAVLDGVATPEEVAHASGCVACQDRLAGLRAAVALVADPPPAPSAFSRSRAVAAALERADQPVEQAGRSVLTAHPVTPRRRSWSPPPWALAAAAALLVLVLAVPLVSRIGDDGNGDDTAAGSLSTTEDADDAFAAGSGAEGDGSGPIDGGHLGELDPGTNLADVVRAALAPSTAAATAGGGGQGDDEAGREEPTARREALRQAAPPAGGECADAPRAGDPDLGRLLFVATATWSGQPAVVYAYEVGEAGELTTRVYVLTQAGCETLNVQSFS